MDAAHRPLCKAARAAQARQASPILCSGLINNEVLEILCKVAPVPTHESESCR